MKALSLRQPWGDLLVHGVKDVENRRWSTRHRGLLVIHAAKTLDVEAMERVGHLLTPGAAEGGADRDRGGARLCSALAITVGVARPVALAHRGCGRLRRARAVPRLPRA